MSPADLAALWDEARAAIEATPEGVGRDIDLASLRLAREGHPKARLIVEDLLPEPCTSCGDDPCPGDENIPEDVKARAAARLDVLTRLRAAMGEP